MQLTIRVPEEYGEKINSLSKRMGLKKSDVIRIALKKFFEENEKEVNQYPFKKIESLLGVAESGIKDLGHRHRHYLIRKIRGGSK